MELPQYGHLTSLIMIVKFNMPKDDLLTKKTNTYIRIICNKKQKPY